LEGRWFKLTASALCDNKLDYSKVSRTDPASLLRERWVLEEIERRRFTEALNFRTFLTMTRPGLKPEDKEQEANELLDSFASNSFPWLMKLKEEQQANEPKTLEEFYHNTLARFKDRKAKAEES
jgi:hypothetical protein